MGYYVQITNSSCVIDAVVKPQVYQIWCDLNHPRHNDQKNGGSWRDGKKAVFWYSWMDEHYDQTCKTAEDILNMLGFTYETLADFSLRITGYESKMGQEDVFFKAVAHLLTGEIAWRGEDNCEYTWTFYGHPTVLAIKGVQAYQDKPIPLGLTLNERC